MNCPICKNGVMAPGKATITLERGKTILVIKGVPAGICTNCGEEYVDDKITSGLLKIAEEAVKEGIQVDIREYVAA